LAALEEADSTNIDDHMSYPLKIYLSKEMRYRINILVATKEAPKNAANQAGINAGARQFSFARGNIRYKAMVDMIMTSHESFRAHQGKPRNLARAKTEFLNLCATKWLDQRPDRQEPRAIKRRPKSFQMLTKPRAVFKDSIRPHKRKSA
jgi:hypothetical protein